MKKITFIMLLVISIVVLVGAIPSIPNVFSGTITYPDDSDFSLTGYEISASIESTDLGVLGEVGPGGSYEVLVDPDGETGTITFYIGGVEASENAEYQVGQFTDLDLSIDNRPSDIVCGNGVKEAGEQCDGDDLNSATCANVVGTGWTGSVSCDNSCSFDISACVAPIDDGSSSSSSSSGSGSSSSGSSSSGSSGGGGGGGGSSSSSSSGGSVTTSTTSSDTEKVTIIEGDNQDEFNAEGNTAVFSNEFEDISNEVGSSGDGITGAAIGAAGRTTWLYAILLLAVLGALAGGVFYVRAKKK